MLARPLGEQIKTSFQVVHHCLILSSKNKVSNDSHHIYGEIKQKQISEAPVFDRKTPNPHRLTTISPSSLQPLLPTFVVSQRLLQERDQQALCDEILELGERGLAVLRSGRRVAVVQ